MRIIRPPPNLFRQPPSSPDTPRTRQNAIPRTVRHSQPASRREAAKIAQGKALGLRFRRKNPPWRGGTNPCNGFPTPLRAR
jgi:hypothetical protein